VRNEVGREEVGVHLAGNAVGYGLDEEGDGGVFDVLES